MIAILLVLGLPLAGAALLAAVGHRRYAPRINIAVSAAAAVSVQKLTIALIVGATRRWP